MTFLLIASAVAVVAAVAVVSIIDSLKIIYDAEVAIRELELALAFADAE